MFVLVITMYVLLGIYEFVPLYKQKLWKEFFVNMGLGIISFCLFLLLSFDIKIPSPAYPIQNLVTYIIGK